MSFRRVVLCLLVTLPVIASANPGKFEITPFGAYSFGGEFSDDATGVSVDVDNAASFGFMLDLRDRERTQWELLYSQQNTVTNIDDGVGGNSAVDMDIRYLQIGGTYQGEGETFFPYVAMTVGATQFDIKSAGYEDDDFFSFSIGPGLQIWPSSRVGLRLETRFYGTFIGSDTGLFCVSNPGAGAAGCAITVDGEIFWQFQASAGIVFRF